MIYEMMCVFDNKAAAFHPPFISQNHQTACRHLVDLMGQPNHPYARHAADYDLYLIGMWDDSTAVVEPAPPRLVIKLISLLGGEQ